MTGKEHAPLPWVVPERNELDLVFFRKVFFRLRQSLVCEDTSMSDIPMIAFQRAMGRLFRVLQIDRTFEAKRYDLNGDGSVGWWEFCVLWKEENLAVRLSPAERIYITFEEPNSSRLGRIASFIILLAIALSAILFIMGTMPSMQEAPCESCQPKPFEVFDTLDIVCVAIFTLEYCTRLFTAAFTRIELINQDDIVEAMCADESIQWPTRWQRLSAFFWAWPNLIDLAAILPSYVTWMMPQSEDDSGSGNPIFKFIKLMRMVRAFRLGRKFEAVMIITRAMKRSVRALSVLVLNMILGMLIFGAIMFFIEGGTYDPKDGAYKRFSGKWVLNAGQNGYEQVFDRSPFESIPAAFWWVLVTSTTVGYGDHYPTTTGGQIAAGLAMVWSLCVLALPVGVIGGNFAAVWQEYDSEKQDEDALRQNQIRMVRAALAQIDPILVSRQLYVAVYHDSGMPGQENNVFIGEAECELELDADSDCTVHKQLRLPLCENRDKCDRSVSGTLFINYTWTPSPEKQAGHLLNGTLTLTVARAVGLAPLDWTSPGFADPYVEVTVNPMPPSEDGSVQAQMRRTRTITKNMIPVWDEEMSFEYVWTRQDVDAMRDYYKSQLQTQSASQQEVGDNMLEASTVYPLVQQLKESVTNLKDVTLPEMTEEIASLKQTTRAILEMLRPPELLELPNSTKVEESTAKMTVSEEPLQEIPFLPSAIPDELHEQYGNQTWAAERNRTELGAEAEAIPISAEPGSPSLFHPVLPG